MQTTKLSSKGQVVLPKPVCVAHHWESGTVFVIEDKKNGIFLRPIKQSKKTASWDQLLGCIEYKGKTKTLEEMNQAVAKGVKARHARGRY